MTDGQPTTRQRDESADAERSQEIAVLVQESFVIDNEAGLHARAATKFVQVASRFAAEVEVERDGRCVNAKSVMGVLMLVAAKGSTITIRGRGPDARQAIAALGELVRNKFGEE